MIKKCIAFDSSCPLIAKDSRYKTPISIFIYDKVSFKQMFNCRKKVSETKERDIICCLTDKPTDQESLILDTHWFRNIHKCNQPSIFHRSWKNHIFL